MNKEEYVKALNDLIRVQERFRLLEARLSEARRMQIGIHGRDSIEVAFRELMSDLRNISTEMISARDVVRKLEDEATAEQCQRLFVIEEYGVRLRLCRFSDN